MARQSQDEYRDGRLYNGFDYDWQAWVSSGKYVRCGHPDSPVCACYGRAHEGEKVGNKGQMVEASRRVIQDHKPDELAAFYSRCNQCEALIINGVFCHEIGCPNTRSRYDAESGEWVKQRKCFECGCTVDADDPCCSAPVEGDSNGN